jgi:DNA polymerase III alpha subunit (gram-positive type)
MTKFVFLDTETTGLQPARRAWDIAAIVRNPGRPGDGVEHQWFIEETDLDLGNADPFGLKVGHFYERHPQFNDTEDGSLAVEDEYSVLQAVESITRGAIIVGAVPNFDTETLGARMREHGILPSWHYHLVDVETLAAGAIGQEPPWDFDAMLAVFGLEYAEEDRHTALGDARMARDLYDAVLASKAASE